MNQDQNDDFMARLLAIGHLESIRYRRDYSCFAAWSMTKNGKGDRELLAPLNR